MRFYYAQPGSRLLLINPYKTLVERIIHLTKQPLFTATRLQLNEHMKSHAVLNFNPPAHLHCEKYTELFTTEDANLLHIVYTVCGFSH